MIARFDFDRPPVVEVVCGVLFNDLQNFKIPHLGLFWSAVRDVFPVIEERPPLERAVEGEPIQVQFSTLPPMARVWLIGEDGSSLLQIQRDRFLYNWKRVGESDAYPRFEKVSSMFEKCLLTFRELITSEKLGVFEPLLSQCANPTLSAINN